MNILGIGPMELVLILVLALIVFGPAKLPEIMAQVGKAIGDFRRATSELSDEFNRTIQAEIQETRAVVEETKAVLYDAHSTVAGVPAPTRNAEPADGPVELEGTSGEPRAESMTNGAVPVQARPGLADAAQWSWETASGPSPADAFADTISSDRSSAGTAEVQTTEPRKIHALPDPAPELLPPY